ncbi:hypothetical protein LQW54_000214 [Pestalotiopsis sp. IQ-011]
MDPKDHERDRRKEATTSGPGGKSETTGWSSKDAYKLTALEKELPPLKHKTPQDKAEEKRRRKTETSETLLIEYDRPEKRRDPGAVTRSRRPSETVDPGEGKGKKTRHSRKAPAAQQRRHLRPPEGYYDDAGSLDYDLDPDDTEDCNTPEFIKMQEKYKIKFSRPGNPTEPLEEDRVRNHGRSSELLSRDQGRARKKTAIPQGKTSLPWEYEDGDEYQDEDGCQNEAKYHDKAECHDKPAITGRRAPSPRRGAHMNNMRQTPAEAADNLTKERLQARFKTVNSPSYHMPQAHVCPLTRYLQGYGAVCACQLPQQGNPYTSY